MTVNVRLIARLIPLQVCHEIWPVPWRCCSASTLQAAVACILKQGAHLMRTLIRSQFVLVDPVLRMVLRLQHFEGLVSILQVPVGDASGTCVQLQWPTGMWAICRCVDAGHDCTVFQSTPALLREGAHTILARACL